MADHTNKPTLDLTCIKQIDNLPYESPKDQFILLSSIPNFHKFGYPGIAQSNEIITPTHISYAEHVLYDPFAKDSVEGNMIRKYIPVPPRNCIMYFLATYKESEMYQICALSSWKG